MSIDLSLTRLIQLFPHLPYTRPTLHIAGTNGKGSVSALLSSILLSSSPPLRIGRFNSPHLVSVRDCITLDNVPVAESVYAHARKEVEDVDQAQGTKLTGFELLTMTALRVFENERVDVVVLEVGMGGRLDATNIVPDACVLASALTAVDLDHQAFLGDTVALIAREKVGIARKGKPFVLGRQLHADVDDVVKKVVEKVGGVLIPALRVQPDQPGDSKAVEWSILNLDPTQDVSPPPQPVIATLKSFSSPIHTLLPLHGAHQLDNLGTTLTVIDALLSHSSEAAAALDLKSRITPKTIARGIRNVKWPGRLSFHTLSVPLPTEGASTQRQKQKLVVLADGAHNPASAKTLGAYITHLLELTLSSPASARSSAENITIPITYILSLSHSPPKTPLQTLTSILPPSLPDTANKGRLTLRPSIALLRFTPPEGMPWVKAVPLPDMREAVRALVPDLPEEDLWVASDGDEGTGEKALEEAFRWAARRQLQGGGRGLVVLAGSLYLVADFYRLLEQGVMI